MTAGWTALADGNPGPALRACLEAAIAAPSVHNTQPWHFRLHDGGIDVLADWDRQLHTIDPQGRALVMSLGAALMNLRVAMLANGRTPILRLLPDGERSVVARVAPGAPVRIPETARMLAQAIPRRRTNRRPFADIAIPPESLHELSDAAGAEGTTLTVVEQAAQDAILGLVRTAENRWRNDPSYWTELARWTRQLPGRVDGVPIEAFGPWSVMDSMPLRDFGLVQPVRNRWTVPFEQHPTIAVLYTSADNQREWLRAGQALQRALLTATVRGLATTLMTQPLEFPELRRLLAADREGRTAQAIIRVGYGPPSPPTRRRPLNEVLTPEPAPVVR